MENHLLYYVSLESGRGLLVSPSNEQVSSQPVHSQLLITFRETASTIHTILHQKRTEEHEDNVWDEEEEEEVGVVKDIREGSLGQNFVLGISSNFLHSIRTSMCIRKCNKNWG